MKFSYKQYAYLETDLQISTPGNFGGFKISPLPWFNLVIFLNFFFFLFYHVSIIHSSFACTNEFIKIVQDSFDWLKIIPGVSEPEKNVSGGNVL